MMNQMLCPCCRALLEQGEMQRLETLSEHVFNPNGEVSLKPSYHCSNKQCKTHRFNIVWNSDGERYGRWDSEWKERMDDNDFIDGNDGPFGSISRQLNVTCYKKGLEKDRTLFIIGDIRFVMEFEYEADTDGNVTKKSWNLRKWKRDGGGWVSYEFPIISFWRTVKEGIMAGWKMKRDGQKPTSGFQKINFCVAKWEDRWWRLRGVQVNRFIFPSLVKELDFRGL